LYPTWLVCTNASITSYKNILRPMLLKVENMDWPSILCNVQFKKTQALVNNVIRWSSENGLGYCKRKLCKSTTCNEP
jgi:hypothetical protein